MARNKKRGGTAGVAKDKPDGESLVAAAGQGVLYVVATPIGNLEDITLRALRLLREADLIAAEDTRHTRKLLTHYEINTPLISYYREKEVARADEILARLAAGARVALVSDAGTPGIADPGAVLVNKARAAGFPVVPAPGPSALTALLSAVGREEPGHLFLGFLPAKGSERRKFLQTLIAEPRPLVFYEAPHRLLAALADCLAVFGDRPAAVGRELSKLHEEIRVASLAALGEIFQARGAVKGEFVILVEGRRESVERPETDDLRELATWHREQGGLSLKDTARRIAEDLGLPRSQVYRQLLDFWDS